MGNVDHPHPRRSRDCVHMNHLRDQWRGAQHRQAQKQYKTKDGLDIYIVEPRDGMLQALVGVPGEGAIHAGYYHYTTDDPNPWIETPATEEDVREGYAKKVGDPIGDWQYGMRSWFVRVKMLEVVPRFRRQGVGTALLDALKEKYRGQHFEWGSFTNDGAAFWKAVTGETPKGPRTTTVPGGRF